MNKESYLNERIEKLKEAQISSDVITKEDAVAFIKTLKN